MDQPSPQPMTAAQQRRLVDAYAEVLALRHVARLALDFVTDVNTGPYGPSSGHPTPELRARGIAMLSLLSQAVNQAGGLDGLKALAWQEATNMVQRAERATQDAPCEAITDCETPGLCLSVGTCKSVHVMPAAVRAGADAMRMPADDTEGGAA